MNGGSHTIQNGHNIEVLENKDKMKVDDTSLVKSNHDENFEIDPVNDSKEVDTSICNDGSCILPGKSEITDFKGQFIFFS